MKLSNTRPASNSNSDYEYNYKSNLFDQKGRQHSTYDMTSSALLPSAIKSSTRRRTRWSRAILTNRLKLKFMKKNNIVKRVMTLISTGCPAQGARFQVVTGCPAQGARSRPVGSRLPETADARCFGGSYRLHRRASNAGESHECLSGAALSLRLHDGSRPRY